MNYLVVIIVLCIYPSKSQSTGPTKLDTASNTKPNTTAADRKVWNLNTDVYFSKNLPSETKRPLRSDVKLRCEAVINFTRVAKSSKNKERMEISLKEFPEDMLKTLMRNIKFYWYKDDKQINENSTIKINTKFDMHNGTLVTQLRIKNIEKTDKGNYTCAIKQKHEKRQTTRLQVVGDADSNSNFEIPLYSSLFPEAESDVSKTTPVLISEDLKTNKSEVKTTVAPKTLEPICQEYLGKVCADHLKGQYVYIPYNTTQATLEEKLFLAVQVTRYSNEISPQCVGYALPSLCYSTFPICRDPMSTNNNFMRDAKQMFSVDKNNEDSLQKGSENMTYEVLLDPAIFNFRYNSTVLRRVCKQDCEILENELCQTEYVIAKRHPHIGLQLTLEECPNLPEHDPECLKIGIGAVLVSDDECYWENGVGYLGKIGIASSGVTCLEWSKQTKVSIREYPELAGRHNYCRNPGGLESQPWCMVTNDDKIEKQLCDIPKCAHKIWIYIVVIFLLLSLTIVGLIVCLCYRHSNKNNPATIRDINLPNADKNIYGDSRLNSPIEMSELLTNQNSNQPHLMRNVRGNGALRVPQYSLSQIKFLEELGEGAFGKVYKGALKIGGDTLYVAVKALKENASAKTQADFRREIDLISELHHDNIVCIVGVALREEPLCMLFEFMARGDLHEFLMGRAPPSGKGLPAMRLLNISHNIASGMHYLASNHYVHRDLAARNCLVSDDFVVKISDFGLSRDIYSSDYYRVQSKSLLPVRWMPPESILYGKFTTESDIWSYGVVLWEIYSYGLQPYYGYSNQEVISMVRGGELLAPPAGCPAAAYALMRDCWGHVPQRRPNFQEIVDRIQSWLDNGGCPETNAGGGECARHSGSARELQERVPLLPHFNSNGSLATGSLKKLSLASTSSRADDSRSVCSEAPPLAPKSRGSAHSLADDRRDTVVRMPRARHGNDI